VRGDAVVVTESAEQADLVVELTEQLLLAMARGEQNPSTAFLTGSMKLVGDLALAPRLGRLLPRLPGA
jgi:putative sterol carrier protein